MKIAYILPSLANKGPIIVADTLIRNLTGLVEEIDVYYFDEKYGQDFLCPTHKIGFGEAIDFDRYDIIHSHMYRPDKYVVKWKKQIKKAKLVSTIHQDIFANLKYSYNVFVASLFSLLWLETLKKFDATVAISSKVRVLYQHRLDNLFMIYNGVDIKLNPALVDQNIAKKINDMRSSGLKILGTYAALTPLKGIEQVLKLMAFREDLAFVIIGEGKVKKKLITLSEKLNVSDRVLWCPYLPYPYNYVALFDLYVMPSRSEGFGLALVEAAMMKASVVCSDIEVFHEIFSEKEVSFFILDNLTSLSEIIDRALENGQEKGELAYQKAVLEFNGRAMALHYWELYNSIINQ